MVALNQNAATATMTGSASAATPATHTTNTSVLGTTPSSSPYDWVTNANNALLNTLARMQVQHALENKTSLFPVKAVTLTGPKPDGGTYVSRMGGVDGQSVRLTVTLNTPFGNLDPDAANNAIHAMLESIPVMKDRLIFAKDIAEQAVDHAAIWNQLQPLLTQSGKFSAAELKMFSDYFERTKDRKAEAPEWSPATVRHVEDKVQVNLSAFKSNDDKSATAPEAAIVDCFTHHKNEVLAKLREKVATLKILSEAELAALDFIATTPKEGFGNSTMIEFGSKPTPPETALGKTALAKIDSAVMQEIFTASMLEARSELPSIFPLVANGEMVAKAIRARVTDNPALHKALDHEMFLSEKDQAAKFEAQLKKGTVEVPNAVEGDDSNLLTLNFQLPHGVTLTQVRESIVRGCQESVLPLAAQPAPINRVAEVAPVGRLAADPNAVALAG
jgi:hypothetical protein